MEVGTKRYLTCAETAKLVRAALKKEFPEQKFSVRSSTYSMGASIDVSWTDGPTTKKVDAVIGPYAGADFDGMVDLKTYSETWLMPDGSVQIARAGGQGSTRPEVITDPPAPDAELVSMGADYVHSHRTISDEWKAELEVEICEFTGEQFESNGSFPVAVANHDGAGLASDSHRGEYGSTLLWQLAAGRDHPSGECADGEHRSVYFAGGGKPPRCRHCGSFVSLDKVPLTVKPIEGGTAFRFYIEDGAGNWFGGPYETEAGALAEIERMREKYSVAAVHGSSVAGGGLVESREHGLAALLRHHVSGAIERGEAEPVCEVPARPSLTEAGVEWAERNAGNSITARIALGGYDSEWPLDHIATAIGCANRAAGA